MKLNTRAVALAGGILWGGIVFVATIWLLISGTQGKTISLLGLFYFGYQFSYVGAFIGLLWGFVNGFIFGYLFALLYNAFVPKES